MIADLSNHLWQSTVFAVAAALLAAAMRRNGAPVRFWLWLAASCKFVIPFSLLTSLGHQLGLAFGLSAIVTPAIPTISVAMRQVAQPFPDRLLSTTAVGADWLSVLLVVVWIGGFAAIVSTRLRQWRRIRAAVRASSPLVLPDVGVEPSVQIRASRSLLEPGVVGLWRPVLLVPAGIEQHLAPQQLKAVLAHELCHVRRRDNGTAAIHMIVEAVFWFHPLVWWIGARLVEERERACDEHVLQLCGEPRAYAEGILNVCKLYVESPLACVSGVTGSNVRQRIEDIMSNRIGFRLNFARKAVLVAGATIAFGAPVVAGMMTAPVQAQVPAARGRSNTPQPAATIQSRSTVQAKEAALKDALFQMRHAIDQYYAGKKQYPSRLSLLVGAGLITVLPADPFTNSTGSWRTVQSKPDPNNPGAAGISDVRSGSDATAANGTKYSEW
jgi:beta-lactamase regulating signal transducer with metallopeptidase domain